MFHPHKTSFPEHYVAAHCQDIGLGQHPSPSSITKAGPERSCEFQAFLCEHREQEAPGQGPLQPHLLRGDMSDPECLLQTQKTKLQPKQKELRSYKPSPCSQACCPRELLRGFLSPLHSPASPLPSVRQESHPAAHLSRENLEGDQGGV